MEFWNKVDVNRRMIQINSIEEFEYTGVLATGGYIDTVEDFCLEGVDVSSIPNNIINNVVKIVKGCIYLKDVAGWSTSLLNDAKCRVLVIVNMELRSESGGRPITMDGYLELYDVGGDLSGLFSYLDVDELRLGHFKSSMLNDIRSSILTDDVQMIEMLNKKVKSLVMYCGGYPFPNWLSKYDGQGRCGRITMRFEAEDLEHCKSWASTRGWDVYKQGENVVITKW